MMSDRISALLCRYLAFAVLSGGILLAGVLAGAGAADAQSNPNVRPPGAPLPGAAPTAKAPLPGAGRGNIFDTEMWSQIRRSTQGKVSIPDSKAGLLIQSDGWAWEKWRNGPMPIYAGYAMLAVVGVLLLFLLIRGRIRVDSGLSGKTIIRFGTLERAGHWLLAVSFIVLALSGLNMVYGKALLMPLIGKPVFADLTDWGKWLHNYVAFAFMVGLAVTFLLWVVHNFPNRHDIIWLLKGGGMLTRNTHPPSKKFNAGQKILFWLVMLGGVSISLSGIALMFPFQITLFADTFAILNGVGATLPTTLTPIQEAQYAVQWHGIIAVFLVCVILGHIYIGTISMEGAFDAMKSGEVDVNWAKEHHSIWAEEAMAKEAGEKAEAKTAPVAAE